MSEKCLNFNCTFREWNAKDSAAKDISVCANEICSDRKRPEDIHVVVHKNSVFFNGVDITRCVVSYRLENGKMFLNLLLPTKEIYGESKK